MEKVKEKEKNEGKKLSILSLELYQLSFLNKMKEI